MIMMHGGKGEESVPLVSVSQLGPVDVCMCVGVNAYVCLHKVILLISTTL